jgi:SAM-dependent methyltransferase
MTPWTEHAITPPPMPTSDVPSSIDYRQASEAEQWAEEAMVRRPWRTEFFAQFAQELADGQARCVLELGSGPGFLAKHLLDALPHLSYTALDFSAPMHAMARARLGGAAERVQFVERSFKDPAWVKGLGPFDHVVTHQAVHELRHKRHALGLHRQVRGVLATAGRYLVCDHFAGDGGMQNDQLYMGVEEQRLTLLEAGFARVAPVLLKGGLILYAGR